MNYGHIFVGLLIELDVVKATAPVAYTLTRDPMGERLHLPPSASCTMKVNGPGPQSYVGTYRELLDVTVNTSWCPCQSLRASLETLVGCLTRQEVRTLHWLATTRLRSSEDRRFGRDRLTVMTAPPPCQRPAFNAAVAGEVAVAASHIRVNVSRPGYVAELADLLRVGERVIAEAADQARSRGQAIDIDPYTRVNDAQIPPAPAGAGADEVVAHHNRHRVWVLAGSNDLINRTNNVIATVNPLTDDYAVLDDDEVLLCVPVAFVAVAGTSLLCVVGPDNGYLAADVAATVDMFSTTVPLADCLAALEAATI